MANTRLAYLFTLHFEKRATTEEKAELLAMIQEEQHTAELNQLVDEALTKQYPGYEPDAHIAEHILSSILKEDEEITSGRKWYYAAAAAVAAVILTTGVLTYRWFKPAAPVYAPVAVLQTSPVKDIAPGSNKAVLVLANGTKIVLDDAKNGQLAQQGNVQVIKQDSGQLTYRSVNNEHSAVAQYNTIATPRGGQYQITLPDGTKAWLNASSSLKYPTAFTGNTRTVELTGEGYFEVAKNAGKAFHVKVSGMDVEVLGTHFNIMAYADENTIRTTLLEGAVRVTKGKASTSLAPGEQASIEPEGTYFTRKKVDTEQDIAWKNGYIQFHDATLPAIMRQVARWYDVEVSYEKEVSDKQFNGKVPRTVPLSQLLSMLQYTGVHFKIQEGKIIILN